MPYESTVAGYRHDFETHTSYGYQTAILAQLIKTVYSVERIQLLQKQAKRNLLDMHLRNVYLKHSDGSWGWSEYAFYDAIMVTAAPAEIPKKLLKQLAIGGIMIILGGTWFRAGFT